MGERLHNVQPEQAERLHWPIDNHDNYDHDDDHHHDDHNHHDHYQESINWYQSNYMQRLETLN